MTRGINQKLCLLFMNRLTISTNSACRGLLLGIALLTVVASQARGETNLFTTHFEAAEGYDGTWTLEGQQGWLAEGTGGNGIVTNAFAGQGQQAYVGLFPPASTNESDLFVWQPINFSPLAAGLAVVKFSVLMSIEDSTVEAWDNFRWSVYNTQAERLFSIDFDNYYWDVSYQLDGTNDLVVTPVTFTNGIPYLLQVTMDFASNHWSATLGSRVIVTNQQISTVNALLNLGDVDAVWLIYNPEFPGDNRMIFDNYQITAESLAPPQPQLQLLSRTGDGTTLLRLLGQSGMRFAIDTATNFISWSALKTNVASDGYFDYIDTSATTSARRFYRGRWVP